ncbi:MAG: radical SAM protein [Armatimonadota bacterium]
MQPVIISWNITKACNLNCVHCYRDAGSPSHDELTTQEALSLVDEIVLCGFKILILSGGEPLLRKDIFRIIKYASDKGLRVVLGTNGTLINREVALELKRSGLKRAGISMDSISEKEHDAFRKSEGAFKKALLAMENLKKINLEFQIHTTVTKDNINQIDKITDFAVKCGARAHHLFFLVGAGRGKDITSDQISPEDQEKLLENIARKIKNKEIEIEIKPTCAPSFMRIAKKAGLNLPYTKGCLAGASYCVILPGGEVHPCPYLPVSAGNVRDKKFSRIWTESRLFNELRLQDLKGSCASCDSKNICGGCRAHAYAVYGDYLMQDPFCIMSAKG